MVGEALALFSALLWATVGVVMASLARRIPAFTIAAARLTFGALFLLPLVVAIYLGGGVGPLPGAGVALLVLSGVLSLGIGDTLYVTSLPLIGVSRAHPISICLFPLFTFVLAVAWLGETLSPLTLWGSSLIIGGVVLVVLSGRAKNNPGAKEGIGRGVGLVVVAAGLWAVGFALLKLGAEGINPAVAGFIRLSGASLFLLMVLRVRQKPLGAKGWGRPVWAGMAWTGLGASLSAGVLIVMAVNYVGIARVSVLTSTSPLFALPLAVFFLGERVGWRTAVGTALAIGGTWLVLLG